MSTMRLPFENIKFVDKDTMHLVTGYMNETQNRLPDDDIFYTIPKLVTTICILFYFMREEFDAYGAKIKVNEKKDTINLSSDHIKRNTVYGAIEVSNKYNMIYLWRIKILQYDGMYNIYIGIDSSSHPYYYRNADFTNNDDTPHYSYGSSGRTYCFEDTICGEEYGNEWGKNDEIKMELNTKEKTLKYWINDNDQGFAFKNIEMDNKIYHMVISLCSNKRSNISVQIIGFQQMCAANDTSL